MLLGKSLGLEIDVIDIEELIAEHSEDLSVDELRQLHEQHHQLNEVLLGAEEDNRKKKKLSTAEIEAEMWLQLKKL